MTEDNYPWSGIGTELTFLVEHNDWNGGMELIMKMLNDIEAREPTHLVWPGDQTACGKPISNGLRKLKVWAGNPLYYGAMSFTLCKECRQKAWETRKATVEEGNG